MRREFPLQSLESKAAGSGVTALCAQAARTKIAVTMTGDPGEETNHLYLLSQLPPTPLTLGGIGIPALTQDALIDNIAVVDTGICWSANVAYLAPRDR